jgi:tripartite-type tricarboxylate transporter receptor subunit TctC
MTHVPYKGSAAAMTDLLGDRITMMFTDIPTAIPHIKAGKLRALGVTSAETSPALPDIKPLASQGLPGFDLKAWYGVMGPANMPPAVAERLNAEINKALKSPEIHEKLMAMGQEPLVMNLGDTDAYVKREIARWAEVVKLTGAKAD